MPPTNKPARHTAWLHCPKRGAATSRYRSRGVNLLASKSGFFSWSDNFSSNIRCAIDPMTKPTKSITNIAFSARDTVVTKSFSVTMPITRHIANAIRDMMAAIRRIIRTITGGRSYRLNHFPIRLKNPFGWAAATPCCKRMANCVMHVDAGHRGLARTNGVRLRTAAGTCSSVTM